MCTDGAAIDEAGKTEQGEGSEEHGSGGETPVCR